MRTCHDPGGRAGRSQGPLRAERRATPPVRLELPFGALYQDGRLDELQGMHDGRHLAAPDLLGPATLGERGDGSNGLGIGLLLEDRLEVPVQAAELGSKALLRRGAPRCVALRWTVPSRTGIVSSTLCGSLAPEGAISPSDRRAARARIAPSSWERNGLPSTAISASGSRSSASSENATRSDARSRKNGRSLWGKRSSA